MKGRGIRIYAGVAGLVDSATGLGLVMIPALVIEAMGLDPTGHPDVWMRFIGAFVLATGSLYLLGLSMSRRIGYQWAFRGIWLSTAWSRLWVGLVTAGLLWRGDLAPGWWSVPVTDLGLGLFQMIWLLTGRVDRDAG